jgi:hypothetical protein
MPFVVMNGAGGNLVQVCRGVCSGAATEGWPQGAASVLNKADGIHRGGARARVCGAGDAGVRGVRTAVWVWVRARRLTMSLSRIQGRGRMACPGGPMGAVAMGTPLDYYYY